MPTAENAKLEYEGGQNAVAMSEMTDSGDLTTFTSSVSLFSQRSGFAPVIRPNGVLTGGVVTAAVSGSNNVVDVSAISCNLQGVVTAVGAATDESITRPATAVSKINSITVTSGGAIAVVAGTDGSTTAFSETRGAAGGPPFIPVDSIELAQVRVTSNTAAAIDSTEIYSVVGLHRETAIYPDYTISYQTGEITFLTALPAVHTGSVGKKVYASYASPIFAEVSLASDFVPPETTHTVSSTQIYNTTLGTSTSTLGQGSFTAYLNDGVTDTLVTLKNEILWFRFHPDRYQTPHILCQGKLGISRTFPADDNLAASCTISATETGLEETS